MKKLLLAGGSHSDIPLIQAAKRSGLYVITSGNRPQDQGHRLADQICLADFSDPQALLELAQTQQIDYICSSSNDFSLLSSAYVAEVMNFPGFDPYETSLLLHHKDKFRAFAAQNGLPCPQAKSFSHIDILPEDIQDLRFPLIVKPVDLTGGKGVRKVNHISELSEAINQAFAISRAKRIVIETFFEGSLHSYSCFIHHGRVAFAYHDNEYSYQNPYLVSTSAGPSMVSERVLTSLKEIVETLVHQLNLVDGLIHAQFLCNDEHFQIIEFTRRCPGDFYAWPVNTSTGMDYAATLLRPMLGLEVGELSKYKANKYVSRHCVMASENGLITGLHIAPEIQANIMAEWVLKPTGGWIQDYLTEKERIVFLSYADANESQRKTQQIHELITLKIQNDDQSSASSF